MVGANISGLSAILAELYALLCPNFVAIATGVGPTTLYMVPLNRPSRKPPSRRKHLRSICHTSRHIGDFCSNFEESILGVRGPKSKIEEQRFVEGVTEN